ncbi:PucR family transcriptional regulator [Nocardioides marmoribigeumensis]|uniref:Methylphosphotriester-DNA--protein-cysteine methyltransferase n=1 Tax=Nocardioides marmoribigeumensis TaxID=433649 RepID=A0ABU2BSQ4_9ACTN|nr:helix-turn-helix domain-containing protein [Nocardioides marmoribigeumensis]MDR7360763.1 methylphosphotriester-DNA--protein-cysteine methyltransferase [Nocardioides marmoribigeumensis]
MSSSGRPPARTRARVVRRMQRAVPALTKTTMARMQAEMDWFEELDAEQRSFVSMVLQAGYSQFIEWYDDARDRETARATPPLSAAVFGTAPQSLTGSITLQQTVQMIRLSIEVAESELAAVVDPDHAAGVQAEILRYGRELAFATADVYAHAAEMRGAWDARLEALVVDSIMRGEADENIRTRASALGWHGTGDVAVIVGPAPSDGSSPEAVVDQVRHAARAAGLEALGAVQGDRLAVVVGGVSDPDKAGAVLAPHFDHGPVVVGPLVDDLLRAHHSAAEAVAGLHAAAGWPTVADTVTSDDLLAERALDGDPAARRTLAETVCAPLNAAGPDLMLTLTSYLDQGGSIEATARVLFVHPNTVRYRLKRVMDVTGLAPADARQAFTLRVAVVLGRLASNQR